MLKEVSAVRFIRVMGSGRNKPCLIECEDEDGNLVELVAKYSSTLIEKEKNLAVEAIASMLAADLGLPIAEPFIVEFGKDFIAIIPDNDLKTALMNSCHLAFGSALHTGLSVWTTGQSIPKSISQCAGEIAIFDQIIVNSDRRPSNPNCLFAGDKLLIIDHELAFSRLLFWRAPWDNSGMDSLIGREHHIFAGPYFELHPTDYERFLSAWKSITDDRFLEYKKAIPKEWLFDGNHVDGILSYLKLVRENITTIAMNALQVLK
jgi:hypothetical protein